VAEVEACGAFEVALSDAASWLRVEDRDEVRTSDVGTVLVLAYGAGLGVGRASGDEVGVGAVGVGAVGVLLVEVSVEAVAWEGATGVDPPSVICVMANAGLVLPESPKTSQRCIFSSQTGVSVMIGKVYSRTMM